MAMKARRKGVIMVLEVYSFSVCLTSAVDGGGWSTPRPGRFGPGKETRYPLYKEAKWTPGLVWTGAKNLVPSPGFDPRTVQPVASRCTD